MPKRGGGELSLVFRPNKTLAVSATGGEPNQDFVESIGLWAADTFGPRHFFSPACCLRTLRRFPPPAPQARRQPPMSDQTEPEIESDATTRTKSKTRTRVSQSDVPSFSLEQALRVATAISDEHAGGPVTPLQLAAAMMMQPTTGSFRQLCGASIAYGITDGGYNASQITLTEIGRRIMMPTVEGDDLVAKREAVLRPRVIDEFLAKYNHSGLPRTEIAYNVLIELGVPKNRTEDTYHLILDNAHHVGLITKINDKLYVDLEGTGGGGEIAAAATKPSVVKTPPVKPAAPVTRDWPQAPAPATPAIATDRDRRVLVCVGNHESLAEPIGQLLSFGEMQAVAGELVSSEPPALCDELLGEMRQCSAAILPIPAAGDEAGRSQFLMTLGAAMALFGGRVVLLADGSGEVPARIGDIPVVEHRGGSLDPAAMLELLRAISRVKTTAAPSLPDR